MRVQLISEKDQVRYRRVRAFIIGCGPEGVARSTLMRRFNLTADALDEYVGFLRQQEGFVERLGDAAGGGRRGMHYIYQPDINRYVDGEQRCIWCTSLAPRSEWGRPVRYCSHECQHLAERVVALRPLSAAVTPNAQSFAYSYAVATDLTLRGWTIFWPVTPQSIRVNFLAMRDGVIGTVFVCAAEQLHEHPELAQAAQIVAVVFGSGHINYRGLVSTVTEEASATGDASVL